MPQTTEKENILLDEEQVQKDDERFTELNKKSQEELTVEEQGELKEIKERYGKRMQKKIDKMTWENRTLAETLEQEKQEKEKLARENEELKKKEKPEAAMPKETYVEINGKKWLTDESLLVKIRAGEITDPEAYKYQRERDREETLAIWDKRQDEKNKERQETVTRLKDAQKVLKEHPNFAKFLPDGKTPNPDFAPDDPLYKLTNEIYAEGYAYVADGLGKALKRAKQIMKISNTHIDRTEEVSLDISSPGESGIRREKEVTLTSDEQDTAEKMYCRGDVINPKTRRPYTVAEAHQAALEAKKARLKR